MLDTGGILFAATIALISALSCSFCALIYFQRIRLERPAIGVFNGRDIVILLILIITLPLLYVILPSFLLTGVLVVTFASGMYIALRPIMPRKYLIPLIIILLAVDIVVTQTLLGTRWGWQIYWVLNSTVVLLSAMGVSNLYVQGGMRLQHIAWFALALMCYDAFFGLVIPLTQHLADSFEGRPLNPAMGFTMGLYTTNVGLGDLLVYSLFAIAAYKGFGRKGAIAAFIVIPVFGALLPGLAPLFLTAFTRSGIGITVPAQTFFGPAAFLTYFFLARKSRERSMADWYAVQSQVQTSKTQMARQVHSQLAP